jgi:hypothetical protein
MCCQGLVSWAKFPRQLLSLTAHHSSTHVSCRNKDTLFRRGTEKILQEMDFELLIKLSLEDCLSQSFIVDRSNPKASMHHRKGRSYSILSPIRKTTATLPPDSHESHQQSTSFSHKKKPSTTIYTNRAGEPSGIGLKTAVTTLRTSSTICLCSLAFFSLFFLSFFCFFFSFLS